MAQICIIVPDLEEAARNFYEKFGVGSWHFYTYGIPFTDTTFNTCQINSKVFENDVERYAAVCRVTGGLRNARIGAIGSRPAAFQTMRFSEKRLQASGNASSLLDWNNNYGDDRNKCVCTHCSNYPKSFIQNEIEISNLDILSASLGTERCFGAIKGKVKAGPFTYFRMATDDLKGNIKAYIDECVYTDDPNMLPISSRKLLILIWDGICTGMFKI